MKQLNIAFVLILLFNLVSCETEQIEQSDKTVIKLDQSIHEESTNIDPSVDTVIHEPRIHYVTYGSYAGECYGNCTNFYKHYLTGNITTFWTDTTDSYFGNGGLKIETKIHSREAERIGIELVRNIPKSILKNKTTRNIFGCPDCADGGGLYFEFLLDEPGAKPIVYHMNYTLHETSGEVKLLGEMIKETLDKLEKYRPTSANLPNFKMP